MVLCWGVTNLSGNLALGMRVVIGPQLSVADELSKCKGRFSVRVFFIETFMRRDFDYVRYVIVARAISVGHVILRVRVGRILW